jgi:hypothetical protein
VGEDDLLQLGIPERVEVEVPGQVAAQPPVGVLDRALRMSEWPDQSTKVG